MGNQPRFDELFSDVVLPELAEHNEGAKRAEQEGVDVDAVRAALNSQQVFTATALGALSFEDWAAFGLPKILAKSVAQKVRDALKNSQAKGRQGRSRFLSLWSFEQLLEAYNPQEIGSRVATEIAKRLRADFGRIPQAFVYKTSGSLDIPKTLELLEGVKRGDEDLAFVSGTDGTRQRVYFFGDNPKEVGFEHPLDASVYLRADGTAPDGFNWGALPTDVAQLLRLAVETEELDIDFGDRERLADTYSRAAGESGFATISSLYPEAAERFHDLKEVDNLPKLRSHRPSRKRRGGGSVSDSRAVLA